MFERRKYYLVRERNDNCSAIVSVKKGRIEQICGDFNVQGLLVARKSSLICVYGYSLEEITKKEVKLLKKKYTTP